MGTLQTWRKAYGALKDQTKLGLAHVNSDFKDVDVAIAKATNHVERPPKERHIRKILAATSAVRPRADVAYCIHTLSRRLAKTHNWTVALKTLIVIHRTLREGDPTFREEVLNFQQRGRFLQMSNFKDDSGPIAWDCSAWVRTYALFLEERLECFRILNYDIESERLGALAQDKGYSKTRDLDSEKLLEHVPALQQLLFRLIGCRPEGAAAAGNYVIQYALSFVLKESFKIYCAINDGIINLVDKFFEMPRHEAIKALDIYRRAGQQAISLSDFYEICKGLELARNFQFPVLKEPPQSFLVTMEEYIKEAPRMFSVPSVALEYPERLMLTYKEEDVPTPYDETKVPLEEFGPPPSDEVLTPTAKASVTPTNLAMDDLMGLNAITEDASGNYNGLDLAIVPLNSEPYQANDFDPNGWELALVTTPSTTSFSSDQERQLVGGLDSLTLNSLYDESAYRSNQQPVYGRPAPNPFEVRDPFAVPNITPRPQTAAAAPFNMVHQNNPFDSFQPIYPQTQQQQHTMVSSQNPFGDVRFMATSPAAPSQTNNPFGGPGAL